jgi:hypothetical protein
MCAWHPTRIARSLANLRLRVMRRRSVTSTQDSDDAIDIFLDCGEPLSQDRRANARAQPFRSCERPV